jgi:hypothetical protein
MAAPALGLRAGFDSALIGVQAGIANSSDEGIPMTRVEDVVSRRRVEVDSAPEGQI